MQQQQKERKKQNKTSFKQRLQNFFSYDSLYFYNFQTNVMDLKLNEIEKKKYKILKQHEVNVLFKK